MANRRQRSAERRELAGLAEEQSAAILAQLVDIIKDQGEGAYNTKHPVTVQDADGQERQVWAELDNDSSWDFTDWNGMVDMIVYQTEANKSSLYSQATDMRETPISSDPNDYGNLTGGVPAEYLARAVPAPEPEEEQPPKITPTDRAAYGNMGGGAPAKPEAETSDAAAAKAAETEAAQDTPTIGAQSSIPTAEEFAGHRDAAQDTPKVSEVKPDVTPEVTPDVTPEVTPEVKPDVTPEVKSDVKPDVTPDVKAEPPPPPALESQLCYIHLSEFLDGKGILNDEGYNDAEALKEMITAAKNLGVAPELYIEIEEAMADDKFMRSADAVNAVKAALHVNNALDPEGQGLSPDQEAQLVTAFFNQLSPDSLIVDTQARDDHSKFDASERDALYAQAVAFEKQAPCGDDLTVNHFAKDGDSLGQGFNTAIQDQRVDITYTVQSGDNLSKIAKEFYGDSNAYNEIAKYNDGMNPNSLSIGQEIKLPPELEDHVRTAALDEKYGGVETAAPPAADNDDVKLDGAGIGA